MADRFLCDSHLGKLAKWLRILGYDTLWTREDIDRDILRKAEGEGRIALTRKRNPDIGGPNPCIVVKADRIDEQITEILETLALQPDPKDRMTLCLRCNAMLETVAKEEVESAVPAHVYRNNTLFRKCPTCGRIYWPGTHTRNIEAFIRKHIPKYPL
jgi:uncharacterized protein